MLIESEGEHMATTATTVVIDATTSANRIRVCITFNFVMAPLIM